MGARATDNTGVVVLDANAPWVRPLYEALAEHLPVTLILTQDPLRAVYRRNVSAYRLRATQTAQRLYEHTVPVPPGTEYRWHRFMTPFWRQLLASAARQMGVRQLVAVLTYPYYGLVATSHLCTSYVYFIHDHFPSYGGVEPTTVARLEKRLLHRCELSICISELRIEEISQESAALGAKLHHLPLAAEEMFLASEPLATPEPLPADIANIPRPVVGVVGNLSDRIDLEFLFQLAAQTPHASFVIVGSTLASRQSLPDLERLSSLPNVYRIGRRSRCALPAYMRSFDVCVIPHRTDNAGKYACPVRLFDYLASTRPILSTNIREVCRFSDCVKTVQSATEAVPWLHRVLVNGSDGLETLRWRLARKNTCSARASQLLKLLRRTGLL